VVIKLQNGRNFNGRAQGRVGENETNRLNPTASRFSPRDETPPVGSGIPRGEDGLGVSTPPEKNSCVRHCRLEEILVVTATAVTMPKI
jgi:hypothetical protein